jgi:hypothetical protein
VVHVDDLHIVPGEIYRVSLTFHKLREFMSGKGMYIIGLG